MAYNNPVRIFVATPVHSEVSIHYFKACLEFQKECFVRKIPVMFQVMKSSLVTQGRQLCVSGFMESECTHLLFIDSDISFNFKMIERMLNYNKEICLVPYPIKGQDTEKVRNRILAGSKLDPLLLGNQYTMSVEDPRNVKVDNGFIEVIRGPAGCMLIKREVIEKLIKEYPDYTIKQHTLIDGKLVTRNFMYNFFDTYWNPEDKTYTGEDFWFCKLCRNIGIRIYALVDEYISHHGEYSYTGRLVDEFMKLNSNSSVQIEAKTINSEVSTNSSDIATKA
jgi:hypothetical protein